MYQDFNSGTAVTSADGGRTFRQVNTDGGGICQHVAVTGLVLWAHCAGEPNPTRFLRSEDGGISYALLPKPPASGLQYLSATTAYAFSIHSLWLTSDGGRTFRRVGRLPTGYAGVTVQGCAPTLLADGTGLAVCSSPAAAVAYRTTDGGRTWSATRLPRAAALTAITPKGRESAATP